MIYRVEDNFLDTVFFGKVKNEVYNGRMPFVFSRGVADINDGNEDNWYFVHKFYNNQKQLSDYYDLLVLPVLDRLGAKAPVSAKMNIYPHTNTIVKHPNHYDQPYDVKSALINFTSCDGYTYLVDDDVEVYSVENRCLHFNSHRLHHSTTTTNSQIRVTMNINYF
jgi:hypothetical protein